MRVIPCGSSLVPAVILFAACAGAPRATPDASALPTSLEPAAVHAHCTQVDAASRMNCYDAALLAVLERDGVTAAMRTLDAVSALDPDVVREGHMYAHSIGLAAYESPATLTARFRACTPSFQSGCYHGVIQSHFSKNAGPGGVAALAPEAVDAICRDNRNLPEGDWLLFQCVHGIGHGLSQLAAYDLKLALTGCDKLTSAWEKDVCYGGALMENVTQAFSPHHTVGRPDAPMNHGAANEHAGMDHGSHAAAPAAKLVDPADPLYPCSMLEDRYLSACYMMQTSIVLNLNNWDFPAAARSCDGVQVKYRGLCYQSLGRDVSAFTVRDLKRAASLCGSGDPEYQPWCHIGFVKNVIDVDADHRVGLPYCALLTRDADRGACYRAVGEQMHILVPDPAKRAQGCAEVEAAWRDTCARAAGVGRAPSQ